MGDRKSRRVHTARRTCVGCRASLPLQELIRLVLDPDGGVVIDLDRRLTGRGAHVCPRHECIEQAVRKDALGRAFRRGVSTVRPDALVDSLLQRLEEKLSGLLGIGQRARQVLSGSMALEKGLQRGEVHLLLLTTDIAPDQRARWIKIHESSGRPWVVHFTKDEQPGKAYRTRVARRWGKPLWSRRGVAVREPLGFHRPPELPPRRHPLERRESCHLCPR